MFKAMKYQLSDGSLHDSEHAARRAAEVRYGDALTALAHELVRADKYMDMCALIDARLDALVGLKALRDDMQLNGDEES